MSFKPFSSYKPCPSGWLRSIPEGWESKRLKFLCKVQTGDKDTENANDDGEYPFFVRSQTVERINSYSFDCEAVLTAGDGAGVGKVYHYYEGKFDFHQRVYMMNDFRGVTGRFFFHFLSGCFATVALEGGAKSTVDSLRMPLFLNFLLTIPPISYQQTLVAFLDRETAKIDALVTEQEKLIALLQEKRQSLISHAVTKGLDPKVPMKDSGIEFIPSVPKHWETQSIRHLVLGIGQGWSPVAEDREGTESEWCVLKLSAIKAGHFYPSQHKVLNPNEEIPFELELKSGDLLLTRANTPELVGDVCYVRQTRPRLILSDLIYNLKVKVGMINPIYLMYCLLSKIGRDQVGVSARGSSQSMVKISQAHILSWKVPLPPLEEQDAIASYIDASVTRLADLIAESHKAIYLLKERRAALITAAVTGKIDVRGLA